MALITARAFLYLLHITALHYRPTTCSLDVDLVSTKCPFMGFCNKEPLLIDHGEDETPCCLPCSCDRDCIHLHNCCPDYDRPPGDSPAPTRSCRSTGYNGAKSEFYYYTQDSCPVDYNDTDVATKCLGDDVESWKDIVMVWSQSRKEVYLNIHCAQCHGVTDASFWQVRHTDCSILSTADTVPLPQELPSSCKISFEPPDPRDPNVLAKTCFPDISSVSDCWALDPNNRNHDEMRERCRNYPTSFYIHELYDGKTVVYKNAFCYLCNNLNEKSTDMTCSKDWIHDPENQRNNLVPFTMVLNLAILEEDVDKECNQNEIYDEMKLVCRRLYCPFYEIPRDGECIERSLRSIGLQITLLLNVTSSNKPLPSWRATPSFLRTISEHFQHSNRNRCGLCSARAFTDTANVPEFVKNFILSITLYTTLECQEQDVIALVKSDLDNFNISVNLNGEIFMFLMQIVMKKQGVIALTSNTTPIVEYDGKCADNVGFTLDEYTSVCPHILISDEDLMSAWSKEILAFDDLLYNKSTNVTERNAVCLSTFLEGIKRYQASIKSTILTTGVVSVVFASLSLLCLLVTLVTFGVLKQQMTLPAVMITFLSANLFLAQIFFIFGTVQTDNTLLCAFFGIVIHYFWLAVVLSMNAYMFLVNRGVHCTDAQTPSDSQLNRTSLLGSIFYTYSSPFAFIGINIGVSRLLSDGQSLGYGGDICFIESTLMRISVFAVPVGILVLANCFLYCHTVRQVRNVGRAVSSQSVSQDQYMTVYLRLSVLTGVSWLFGFIFEFTRDPFTEYCFIVLTTGQGIFIMLCFICRQAVLRKAIRFSQRRQMSHRTQTSRM